MFRCLCLLIVFLLPTLVYADNNREWEPYWQALTDLEAEDMAESGDMAYGWEYVYDRLCELEGNPIDINNTTRDELEQLPFLTNRQVEDICEHLYRNDGMRSKGELMTIRSLDYNRRKLLECFIFIGDKTPDNRFPSLRDITRYGRNELTAMGQIPFYKRKGDKNGYLGYPYKHWLRYDFRHGNRVRLGVVASQDAGEPFFSNGNNMGYDYYSFYLQLKECGRLSNLIVGRYRASFGMGLVVNTGFSMGKQTTLAALGRQAKGFTPHSSRSEQGYFQGVAATADLGKGFSVSTFASYRNIDATLNKTASGSSDGGESADKATIATILYDGYHRTPGEMAKKGNSHAIAAGAHIAYKTEMFDIGMTTIYTRFDRDLQPKTKNASYRRYYPAGNDFLNVGVDYRWRIGNVLLRGEAAVNRSGYVATINKLGMRLVNDIDIILLHRYYSHRYTALYAQSFSDGSRVNNEHGVYAGLTWRLSRQWNLSAYSDFAYFYWPKYQISRSSWTSDNVLVAEFNPSDDWTFNARYRLRIRQRDNENKSALINKNDHRLSLSAAYNAKNGWSSRTRINISLSAFKQTNRGFMVSQTIARDMQWLKVSVDAKYFNTDDYDSRLYAYEPGLPHTFYFPAYYGHGIRYSFAARVDITSALRLTAKLGTTNYFNRSTISSDLREINASSMTDAEVMLRWKF